MTVAPAFSRYSRMKGSTADWLEEIPEHWEVLKLRHTIRSVTERNRSDLPLLSVVREKGVIVRDVEDKDENHNFIPDDLTNYKVVKRRQFAMNKMKAWQGSYGVSDHDGIVSPAYFVFDIAGVGADYFHMAIRSKAYVPHFTCASDGVRIGQWDLSIARMREIPFVVPPLSEQAAIVRFLDHADRRIRRYIRAKQKLIALLEEQKQAIIHQAVTGQIDVRTGQPYPAYRDSGVEWMGDVPKHWTKSERIKYLSTLKGRLGWQGLKAGEYTTVGPYVVSSAHFNDHKINWGKCPRVTQERYERDEHIQLRQGDILLMKDGAAMGKLAFVDGLPGPACLNSHLLLFRPLDFDEESAYFPQYMFYYMQTECFQGYVQINGTGATFLGISQESVGNYKICLPPHSEQVAIVEHLDESIAEIDMLIGGANHKIELLGEYQARLIADVVTGKLDVREAAAGLSEEDVLRDAKESAAEYTNEISPGRNLHE